MTEVENGGNVYMEPQKEKLVFLKKRNKDQLLGFRFTLHPDSRQVIVSELYPGYVAQQSGKVFVGDVVSQINGIRVTEVDMATQLIKMAEGTVEVSASWIFPLLVDPPICMHVLTVPLHRCVHPAKDQQVRLSKARGLSSSCWLCKSAHGNTISACRRSG